MEEVECVTCGKLLKVNENGITWRECSICKKPVCFNDIHYIGTWVRGLYRDYITVIPVCEKEFPKKRRVIIEE
jgi:hypothetical protein